MTVKVIGGKIPPKEHRKLQVEDCIEDIFDRLVFAKMQDVVRHPRSDCRFMPSDMGPMWVDVPSERGDILFSDPSDVNSPDLVWPVGVGLAQHIRNHDEWGNHISCNYWQSIDAKLLRGSHRFVGSKNIGHYRGFLEANRQWSPIVSYGAWHFGKWRSVVRNRPEPSFWDGIQDFDTGVVGYSPNVGEEDFGITAALGQSVALTYRYEWGAQFSIGPSPRLIVPVTPRGILDLFNDRDKPSDRNRRASLRHWVSQHRRIGKAGSFRGVRAHLRGNMKFNWRGFDVTILPSQFDDEKSRGVVA